MKTLEKVILIDYNEFDKLVNDLIYNGEEVSECVADNEWDNYEDHLFEFSPVIYDIDMKPDSYYYKYQKPKIINKDLSSGVHGIFTYLFENNLLEKGNYLIRVSW